MHFTPAYVTRGDELRGHLNGTQATFQSFQM